MDGDTTPSPALLDANRLLLERRQNEQRLCDSRKRPFSTAAPWEEDTTLSTIVEGLPAHLGWNSQATTLHLRQVQKANRAACPDSSWCKPPTTTSSPRPPTRPQIPSKQNPQKDSIKLYPDIALGMLRQEKSAAGRIWLLLRYLDQAGQGWVTVNEARQQLTRKEADLRAVGWRQLRNLLHEGEGLYWHRDKERIWLWGVARVGAALNVERLTGLPVALPVKHLLKGMMAANAHLYASFHSGRKSNKPISREALAKVSGIAPRMQRLYEEITGTEKKRNIAIGEAHTPASMESRAWTQHGMVFVFIDHYGRQGPAKQRYIAWHLPNSYTGSHAKLQKGRQRKINKRIDLVNIRARGNDVGVGQRKRLFHDGAAKAVDAHECDDQIDAYWTSETDKQTTTGVWFTRTLR